jgi:gliding motility-associated-like protein
MAIGGTALFTGNPYTTPTLTNNTTYYAEAQTGNCYSTSRTAVTVSVEPTPPSPTATDTTICSGQSTTVTATAAAGTTINWYQSPTGGTALQTGSSYTTATLTNTTTYYAAATLGNCASPRTAVTVTVNQPPSAPTAAGTTICSGQPATLTATAPNGVTFNWYQNPTGGAILQTGSSYTTVVLNGSTTYYVESFNGCSSARTAVTVSVNTPPTAPTVAGATICSGQTATLTATAPTGVTYNWYDVPTAGTALATGNSYTTPILNTTTTYYVSSEVPSCPPSGRTAVTVNVEPTPAAPTAADATICSGETATLTATAPTGVSYNWYQSATGGATLQTGSSYTTAALSNTTQYYIESALGNCVSARTAVTVTVNQPPSQPATNNVSICEGQTATLTATSSTGATIRWYTTPTGGTALYTGSSYTTAAINTNTTYYVEAEFAGCPPTSRVAVQVTVLTAPPSPVATGTTICSGESAMLTASTISGADLYWYDSPTATNPLGTGNTFTTPTLGGSAAFYVAAQQGSCQSSQRTEVIVNVLSKPLADFEVSPRFNTAVTVSKALFQFTNKSIGGNRYVWYFGDGDSLEVNSAMNVEHQYATAGSYNVKLCVQSSEGCSECIEYGKIIVIEDYAVYIPNAFSPNGDGNNDMFEYAIIGAKETEVRIYNKWGEKVFETTNPREYWDGRYKGEACFTGHLLVCHRGNKEQQPKGGV